MATKIAIDPGHAPGNVNAGPSGYMEYAGMWKLSNYLKEYLEQQGFEVLLTRTEEENPTLTERAKRAAQWGADMLISEHSNSANGNVRGVEVYYSITQPGDKPFAAGLAAAMAELMDTIDRGAKVRESTTDPGFDYYTIMFVAQQNGVPHVFLIENGFHDNLQDEAFLLDEEKLRSLAKLQAQKIAAYYNVPWKETTAQRETSALIEDVTLDSAVLFW